MDTKFARFSLTAIFLVVLVVSGFFVGLNRGFQTGRSQWMNIPTYTKTYSVKDWFLLSSKMQRFENEKSQSRNPLVGAITAADFEPIISEIQRNVRPHVWRSDPNTKIDTFVAECSLVVNANATVHHELERYLEVARLNAENNIVNYKSEALK